MVRTARNPNTSNSKQQVEPTVSNNRSESARSLRSRNKIQNYLNTNESIERSEQERTKTPINKAVKFYF